MEDDFNKDDEFMDFVRSIGEQIMYLRNLAVVQYTPLVGELCRRDAELNEVERMLDYLLDFADDNRILKLYKRVCRTFFYTYPDSIAFYVMEYRKQYDRESLIGTEYEYLLHEDEDDEDD